LLELSILAPSLSVRVVRQGPQEALINYSDATCESSGAVWESLHEGPVEEHLP
jgi:hypothetical protein